MDTTSASNAANKFTWVQPEPVALSKELRKELDKLGWEHLFSGENPLLRVTYNFNEAKIEYKGFKSFIARTADIHKVADVMIFSSATVPLAGEARLRGFTYPFRKSTHKSATLNKGIQEFYSVKEFVSLLKRYIKIQSKVLESHEVEASSENVVKLWAYEFFVSGGIYADQLGYTGNHKKEMTARLCELVDANLNDYIVFCSLSHIMATRFASTGEFDYSIEALKELDNLPLDYIDKIISLPEAVVIDG